MNPFENMLYKALYDVMDAVLTQAQDVPAAPAANETLREAA